MVYRRMAKKYHKWLKYAFELFLKKNIEIEINYTFFFIIRLFQYSDTLAKYNE